MPPQELPEVLAQVVKAVAEAKQQPVPAALAGVKVGADAKNIAASLASGTNAGIFLGNLAAQHPQAAQLRLLAQELAGLLRREIRLFRRGRQQRRRLSGAGGARGGRIECRRHAGRNRARPICC